MKSALRFLIWLLIALLGAGAYLALAVRRGEGVNSIFILTAALCTYAIAYRFYSKWIAARVLALDDRRATPCEVHDDGRDFVKTNKWIVFGHHFAAISGPGPLVGPVLAAQFGFLPGTLWILIGAVLGGAVQDMVILFCSVRRNGKSLGQMVKEEINTAAGTVALVAILSIMLILLAVLALVVVNALAESPWGVFTVGATVPIAMFMGGYLRFVRIGKVLEATVAGVVLLLLAVWGGQFIHAHESWARAFTLGKEPLAWAIIVYGLAASVLPVWLLLAPRDYLSTFMKLGTIFALAIGVFFVLPDLKMPAVTKFIDGSGPVVPGKLFPFCFITIACGAISGFHTLIASGTTPKITTRESHVRSIGYGAMCLESLVAIMAMVAACTLDPGIYMSMNTRAPGADAAAVAASTVARVNAMGPPFHVTAESMQQLADQIGEKSLFGRTGGAATLAVGMAQIFSKAVRGRWLDLWYHFAIMFEALFILTTLDAGTRVGRYLLQDALGSIWRPLGEVKNMGANVLASLLIVAGWGWFLIQGVRDPEGGVKALWPLFGIANQMLAGIALCFATTVILKMQLSRSATGRTPREKSEGRPVAPPRRLARVLVTLIPLVWLLSVTLTAGVQKIFHHEPRPDFPRVGFLQIANELDGKLPAIEASLHTARTTGNIASVAAAEQAIAANRMLRFNNLVDAVVAGIYLVLILFIVALSVREWILLLARKKAADLRETEPVWLPHLALADDRPFRLFSLIALALALVRELSGQAAIEREQQILARCSNCERIAAPMGGLAGDGTLAPTTLTPLIPPSLGASTEASKATAAAAARDADSMRGQAYLQFTTRRFNRRSINQCC